MPAAAQRLRMSPSSRQRFTFLVVVSTTEIIDSIMFVVVNVFARVGGPVSRVAAVAALRIVFVVAEMLFHLDLETGFQHLFGQFAEQPFRADQIDTISPGLLNELLRDRRIDR
jgi:hypothetical protein